ncbi:MAG: metal ABC transporter substrate-binding protein [Bacillota bacterium]
MTRYLLLFIACLSVLIFITGCGLDEIESEEVDSPVQVVTTIYPLSDIITRLGGEKVNVSYLLPAGASPHTYEPTIEQARLIERADLVVYIGAGLDDWAVKLAESSESNLILLDLSKEISLIEPAEYRHLVGSETGEHDCDDHNHQSDECKDDCDDHNNDHEDCDHHHGPEDPHFWLDPIVVRDEICAEIFEMLVSISPEDEEYFKSKFDLYYQDLTELHQEIENVTAEFSHRSFIAFHSAWQYFGLRYDLQEVAVIAQFPGQEPSAGWLAHLIAMIKDEDIAAIYAEPQYSTALADRISEETGITVKIIDPLGGEDMPGRESYIEMMQFNLASFREALE